MNNKKIFGLGVLVVALLLTPVYAASSNNISILYGWNGTNFVPVKLTDDGKISTDINMTQSVGLSPQLNNTYDLGTAAMLWANLYVRSIRSGSILSIIGDTNVTGTLYVGGIVANLENATGLTNVSLLYGVNHSNTGQQVPLEVDNGALKLTVRQTNTNTNNLVAGATGTDLTLDRINVTGTTANSTFAGDVRIFGTLYGGSPLKISGLNVTDGNLFVTGALVVNSTTITGASASGWTISGNNVYNDTLGVLFGIGTLSPTALLHISGTSSANNISLNVNNTLYVNVSSNRVGIGTSSPAATLHVVSPAIPTGSGGDSTYDIKVGDVTYRVHKFTTVGNSTFTVPAGVSEVEYLVVAGGGGGAGAQTTSVGAGGGGAGGFRTGTLAVTAGNKTVTVGAGGAGGPAGRYNGTKGNDSVFDTIVSLGGGFAAEPLAPSNVVGGSGGGGGATLAPGLGTAGQGYAGGYGDASWGAAGGGGGASGVGGNASSSTVSGYGGNGTASSISGTSTYYAGGGGGGAYTGTAAPGGTGGGGAGGLDSAGVAGTANTGGGGGGGGAAGTNRAGGAGGSGIVIIRYVIPGPAFEVRSPITTNVYGSDATNSGSFVIFGGTFQEGYPASLGFDNSIGTIFSVPTGATTAVGQDFGAGNAKNIRRVRIYRSGTGSYGFNAKLQYSDNNASWSDTNLNAIAVPVSTTWTSWMNVNDYGVHRYWRFLDRQTEAYLQADEIEMVEYPLTPTNVSLTVSDAVTVVGNINVTGTAYGSVGVIKSYTVTLANATNTASETDIITFTVPANTWADGEVIQLFGWHLIKNNKGSSGTFGMKQYVGGVSIAMDNDAQSDSAIEQTVPFTAAWQRVGNDVWQPKQAAEGRESMGWSGPYIGPVWSGWAAGTFLRTWTPDFASDIVIRWSVTPSAANANFYIKPKAVKVWKIGG